jgi:uncharacterized protein
MTSKLILGTVQMGLPYGVNNSDGKIPFEQSVEILNLAFDNEVRYLDTAEAYGNAHKVIGDYHKKHPHKKFEIITKLSDDFRGKFDDKINEYLNDLAVDKLNALLFHSFYAYKTNVSVIQELNDFKKQGLIDNIGVSVYTNKELEIVVDDPDIDIIQLPFNLFDNINERGKLLQEAKNKGKIIHTRSCFLQGLFYMPVNSNNKVVQGLKNELIKVHQISKENNLSIAQLALSYCLQQKNIDNVLIGVDNARQLGNNIKDAETRISYDVINEINLVKIENKNLLNPVLWKTI